MNTELSFSIKVKNPIGVARMFELPVEDCIWWVGTPYDLHPSKEPKPLSRIISARVQYWSDGACIKCTMKSMAPEPPIWKARHCNGWAVRTLPRVLRGEITGKVCPIFAGPLGYLP